MARLDAADRQGALKVMGKLFEELAAATNASGKDIKRENNADKDKKYILTNQYSRKESVRLKPGQDSLFTRFNNLVVAGALKDAYNLDLETTPEEFGMKGKKHHVRVTGRPTAREWVDIIPHFSSRFFIPAS